VRKCIIVLPAHDVSPHGTAMTQSQTSYSQLPQHRRPRRKDNLTNERNREYNILMFLTFHFIHLALMGKGLSSTILVPNIPPNLIITTMCVDVSLIPLLRRTDTTVGKVTRLGGLAVRLDAATFVERDLAVVACARGGGAVFYLRAGEFAFDVCGVDAGFGC